MGRLERRFGNDAFYVYLIRDLRESAESFSRRAHFGIMQAYKEGILLGGQQQAGEEIALDYLDTVQSNIALFLKDKTRKMEFRLQNATTDFNRFWEKIGAQGDFSKALTEWQTRYNASS